MRAETLAAIQQAFPSQERVRLPEERAAGYIGLLCELLAAGRLNKTFCDRDRLADLYRHMAPPFSHGAFPELEIGVRTGLPTEREVTRIHVESALAAEREPAQRSAFQRSLVEHPVLPSAELSLQLRRVEGEDKAVELNAMVDRFELSEELFCRYTLWLRHEPERQRDAWVLLDDGALSATERFRNEMERRCAWDAELSFLRIADLPGLTVREVTRTCFGVLCFAGTQGPPPLQELMDRHPGELVLSLTSERASKQIDRDSDDDPFTQSWRSGLDPDLKAMLGRRLKELGCRIRRERKFVCTPGIREELRDLLKRLGARCVIYALPVSRD